MKNRLVGIVLVFLVLANIATLGVFWYYKIHIGAAGQATGHPGDRRAQASAFIIKQVGFTAAQQKQYLSLVQQHQQQVRRIREQLHLAKDALFDSLSDTTITQPRIDELAAAIAALDKELDIQTYAHFKQVRAICTPEQKIKLDNCIKQVMRMMAPPADERPGGPPRGEGGSFGPQGQPPAGGMPPPRDGEGPPPAQ